MFPIRLRIAGFAPIDAERTRIKAIDKVSNDYDSAGTLVA